MSAIKKVQRTRIPSDAHAKESDPSHSRLRPLTCFEEQTSNQVYTKVGGHRRPRNHDSRDHHCIACLLSRNRISDGEGVEMMKEVVGYLNSRSLYDKATAEAITSRLSSARVGNLTSRPVFV
ncbi:hypothetical protein EVAR_14378_1 [Eumeta japonica]|uniref:Uncharacterized protein n=1 Tax=Eumeta variegata TaxID=151549 RepID=A0A4C1TXF4_EUMVA|nr:hypothetical protein EVAR_14378_1 [Eumeta japonica]